MHQVAVATVSRDAALAGVRVVRGGGNAVDAALASAFAAVVTHPGMCSLGGGGFITVSTSDGETVTVDGGHEMPGRGLPREALGRGGVRVEMEYAGGIEITVGPGSVAIPGLLAACALAARRWGRLPWRSLLEPAVERARDGFPMPESSHAYLSFAHGPIYARDPRGRTALEREDGTLKEPGETIRVPGLADTLEALARRGPDLLYRGELGRTITGYLRELGGILTMDDLEAYRPRLRDPVRAPLDGWRVHAPPAPAVGGPTVAALLTLLGDRPREGWTAGEIHRLSRAQRAVLSYRRRAVDAAEDPAAGARRMLALAGSGRPEALRESASTLHVSAVDSEGRACSATFSDGYGSGIVPPGTGLWLNNCLGERELNRRGFHGVEPGTRLISNMAPSVARGPGGAVLAVGSPGSARIPTAVHQVLVNHLRLGMELGEAVAHPRLHVDPSGPVAHCEAGLPTGELQMPVEERPGRAMFFGGVEAASWHPDRGFRMAADTRRTGGTAVS